MPGGHGGLRHGRQAHKPPGRLLVCALLAIFGVPAFAARQPDPHGGRKLQQQAPLQPLQPLQVPWQPLLTEAEIRRGAYFGSLSQMRAVADKLLAGQPIRVVMLGGSVTNSAAYAAQGLSYATRFFSFINTTWPNPGHSFVNWGQPSANSAWFAPCVDTLVGKEADLVVVEFAVNDKQAAERASPQRRTYEQLLRRLLGLPSRPAVVMLHHYSWHSAAGDGTLEGLFYGEPESTFQELARYYDLPSMSLRGAAWRQMYENMDGFKVGEVMHPNVKVRGVLLPQAPAGQAASYVYDDFVHPSPMGHQLLAELLCAPLIRAEWEAQLGLAVGERRDPRLATLPPPMIPNQQDSQVFCALQEAFPSAVAAQSDGFVYQPDNIEAGSFREQMWGFSASQPGDSLTLQVNTQSGLAAGNTGQAQVIILFQKGNPDVMGAADVACISGCTCQPARLDATWPARVKMIAAFELLTSMNARCRIQLTVAPDSANRTVMLAGVVVNLWQV